jgi:hypothetical protein
LMPLITLDFLSAISVFSIVMYPPSAMRRCRLSSLKVSSGCSVHPLFSSFCGFFAASGCIFCQHALLYHERGSKSDPCEFFRVFFDFSSIQA